MAFPLFKEPEFYESACSIRLNRLFLYDQYTGDKTRSRLNNHRPKSNKRDGKELSKKAQIRVNKRIELLYDIAKTKIIYSDKRKGYTKYKIGFITLTLASKQIHSDNEIHYNCFAPFIRIIKQKHPHFLFVWKAETQENGNLHYHISTNAFIHKKLLNTVWNNCQNKLGYIDRYGKESPPSTKIQACFSVDGLAMYMAKYMSKNEENRRIPEIKLWDCSIALKKIKTSDFIDFDQQLELEQFNHQRRQLTETNAFGEKIPMECYMYNLTPIMKKQCPNLMQIWNKQIEECKQIAGLEQKVYYLFD